MSKEELCAQIKEGKHPQFIYNTAKQKVTCRCGHDAIRIRTGYICATITAYPCRFNKQPDCMPENKTVEQVKEQVISYYKGFIDKCLEVHGIDLHTIISDCVTAGYTQGKSYESGTDEEVGSLNSETYADMEAFKNFMVTVTYREVEPRFVKDDLEYNANQLANTLKKYPVIWEVGKSRTILYFMRYIKQVRDLASQIEYYRYLGEKQIFYLYDGTVIRNIEEQTALEYAEKIIQGKKP